MKVYRGSATAARTYVEADRSRVDDYYLAEGTAAELLLASPPVSPLHSATSGTTGDLSPVVQRAGILDGDAYEAWVAGYDRGGRAKGRLRSDDKGVRFAEVVVNGPKTYSLAAALHPEVAAAYDAAQESAARQIVGWVAEHATTRIGPRGRQVQVGVEQVEAAVVRHYTSRAGDPHRHLHVQINARVFATGKWRAIHTVGIRDSLDAINGIGRAAIQCDLGFRRALAAHGYTLDALGGEIRELAPFVGEFSARAAQIGRNVDRYEAQWRTTHRGEEPGPRVRRTWDTRAWAEARPDKVVPTDGAELARRWVEELHGLGFVPPGGPAVLDARQVGMLDRDKAVEIALQRLGARRSAWNAADVRGEVEQIFAMAGIVAEPAVRTEAVEDLTGRALAACVPLLARDDVPEHVRALTSPRVLEVEADLVARLTTRAATGLRAYDRRWLFPEFVRGLDQAQRQVVAALIGRGDLVVIEGAAGAGKTATLAAARRNLTSFNHRMVIATPTLKAAEVAGIQAGTKAYSAAWLIYQYGYRWDQHGRWARVPDTSTGVPADPQADLNPGDILVIDEGRDARPGHRPRAAHCRR
jgi:exodeoxyribonuclease V alpha subunit